MFGAAEEGYASDPGPRSLGFSNPGAYTWLANLYLDGPGLGRWARATARRGPGAIGPGLWGFPGIPLLGSSVNRGNLPLSLGASSLGPLDKARPSDGPPDRVKLAARR